MVRVRTGTIKIKASQWPSFLYPRDAQYDPDNIDAGLFEGEIFLQVSLFPKKFVVIFRKFLPLIRAPPSSFETSILGQLPLPTE